MTTEYEYYDTGDDGAQQTYGTRWSAQTFTTTSLHTITSVKLKLYKSNNPGTITVSIRATDGDGHPTGSDLTSGTYDGNSLGGSPGAFVEIPLTEYTLTNATKYAIVVRAPSGPSASLYWRSDGSSPAYSGGNSEVSTNSGSSWTAQALDYMFQVWGNPGLVAPTVTTQAASNLGLD